MPSVSPTESTIKAAIRRALGVIPAVKLFDNPVGMGYVGKVISEAPGHSVILGNPRRVPFGLFKGSSDLIGWTSRRCECGRLSAVFTALEVKAADGSATVEQKQFISNVRVAGGLAGVVRSIEEARKVVEE